LTDYTKEELLAEQLNCPGQLEAESTAWWAAFIEHWAARGVDRKALNAAVVKFRDAQKSLSAAIAATR
jgi:hypothetical protein